MMNRSEIESAVDARLRTLRILWAAFVASIGLYGLIAGIVAPATTTPASGAEQTPFVYICLALGIFFVTFSFVLRQSFYRKAEREGRAELVQTGLIIALAFCEVAALLGLVVLFLLATPLAYLLFAFAVFGDLFHFPRRDQLLAASQAGRPAV